MPLTLQRRAARLAEAITAVPRLDGETDQSIRPSPIDGEAATIHQWGPERRVRGAAAAGGEERPPCQPLRSLRGGPRPLLRWFHSSSSLDCGPPPCSQCDTIGPRLSSSALLQPASLLATPATSRCPLRQRLSRWTAGRSCCSSPPLHVWAGVIWNMPILLWAYAYIPLRKIAASYRFTSYFSDSQKDIIVTSRI